MNIDIAGLANKVLDQVEAELPGRGERAAIELKNASLEVLRGQRGGRKYGKHTASAPGEPPAARSGTLMKSFRPVSSARKPYIETNVPYAGYMQDGTPGGMIAPRPYKEKIIETATPAIEAIYSEPYNL